MAYLGANTANAADLVPTIRAEPLPVAELHAIYAGHTWHWDDGAGYFGPAGEFQAWSIEDERLSYGFGQWTIPEPGVICFGAVWHYNDEATEVTRCFGHIRANGVIYQRVEPDGAWYIFRSDPPQPGDEIQKFTLGDEVSSVVEQIRAQ
jgi:hypothetical protein